jgi:serine protease Do
MRKYNFKELSLCFMLIFMIQCQGKPTTESLENGNYKELVELIQNNDKLGGSVSFVAAAAISTPCVVHIKTKVNITVNTYHPFQGFFGFDFYSQPQTQKQESSGSGVIVASDGYIVTNYHVIQNATEIEVTLRNKNTYKAKLIGSDKDADLAVIKIEENELPVMQFANSDSVMVGEWVLAVGNPFNLESTVTQGIVSAKGRALNMGNQRNTNSNPIESFIQTDAAVNPGNSGGALVNLNGELIGINTAIASPTGAYAGYSFAVPSNIVHKVIEDLKKYGKVQRAFLGIQAEELTSDKAKKLSLPSPSGVLIRSIEKSSAAESAGLKAQDVIIKINENKISSFPELLEHLSTYRPGEKVEINYIRLGKLESTSAILKNKNNTTEIVKEDVNLVHKLGLNLESISQQEKMIYQIQHGLKVTKINDGIIAKNTEMKAGFMILQMNNIDINEPNDISKILETKKTGDKITIEGFYPNRPYLFQYTFIY